jgi:hypothetical protein
MVPPKETLTYQQKHFTFVIPYSPYTNDDDDNGNTPSTLNRTSEFSNGIHGKRWELT